MDTRLGFLGGTFDPVHVGHRVVAQDIVEKLDLDRLLVVPAGRPPHREAVFAAADRLAWTRAAFEGDDRVEVSDLELRRSGPSYTVDTVERVLAERAPGRLFCVIGVDQLEEIGSWRAPDRIAGLSTLTVMSRAGEDPEALRGEVEVPFETVGVTRIDLSSRRIRRRLSDGRGVRYLVPEGVRREVEATARDAFAPGGGGPRAPGNDPERRGY
ncbi:MAG: nicotinate-nucleotide adenylyltransferase [Gemmatimonadota bacterium]